MADIVSFLTGLLQTEYAKQQMQRQQETEQFQRQREAALMQMQLNEFFWKQQMAQQQMEMEQKRLQMAEEQHQKDMELFKYQKQNMQFQYNNAVFQKALNIAEQMRNEGKSDAEIIGIVNRLVPELSAIGVDAENIVAMLGYSSILKELDQLALTFQTNKAEVIQRNLYSWLQNKYPNLGDNPQILNYIQTIANAQAERVKSGIETSAKQVEAQTIAKEKAELPYFKQKQEIATNENIRQAVTVGKILGKGTGGANGIPAAVRTEMIRTAQAFQSLATKPPSADLYFGIEIGNTPFNTLDKLQSSFNKSVNEGFTKYIQSLGFKNEGELNRVNPVLGTMLRAMFTSDAVLKANGDVLNQIKSMGSQSNVSAVTFTRLNDWKQNALQGSLHMLLPLIGNRGMSLEEFNKRIDVLAKIYPPFNEWLLRESGIVLTISDPETNESRIVSLTNKGALREMLGVQKTIPKTKPTSKPVSQRR